MMSGECLCGAVAFEIAEQVNDVFVCHCSICRRSTGTHGIAVLVMDNEKLRWTRGEDQINTYTLPGHDWQTWFCKTCGSPLPGANDEARMFVPAGLITQGVEHLSVSDHIFVDSKAPWDEIGDAGRRHPEQYKP